MKKIFGIAFIFGLLASPSLLRASCVNDGGRGTLLHEPLGDIK